MSKHKAYDAKHRSPKRHAAKRHVAGTPTPRKMLRNTALLGSLAAAATGVVVSGGIMSGQPAALSMATRDLAQAPAANKVEATLAASEIADRDAQAVSRSDRRTSTDAGKAAALSPVNSPAAARTEDLSDEDPRVIAAALLPEFGFGPEQFSCLDALYTSESGWRIDADNPTSSAYGIPQALTQLHDLPDGYLTSAEVQIRWGLDYIQEAYGTPCGAWAFKQSHNWY